jgi:hypothetical protein
VFIEKVGEWLVEDKNEDEDDVVEALVGLISYGATTEEKLQNVADDKKGFADRLSPKGVPDAICDLLFEQYVAKSRRESGNMDGIDNGRTRLRDIFNMESLRTLGNDGISFAAHHLRRENLVVQVLEHAQRCGFVVIRSPPATGKTSLAQLIGVELEKSQEAVCYLPMRPSVSEGAEWLFLQLRASSGINLNSKEETIVNLAKVNRTWVLLDDAQNAYDEKYWPFWEALVKDLNSRLGDVASKIRCIIVATYDLSTPKSPVQFSSIPHIPANGHRLTISDAEADELYMGRSVDREWVSWEDYKATLKYISNGHIGVFMQGLRMLEIARTNTPRVTLKRE